MVTMDEHDEPGPVLEISGTPSYTDEQVLAALRAAASMHGQPLSVTAYDRFVAQQGVASRVRVIQRWKTWNAACQAAGLEINAAHSGYKKKWTESDMLEFVADYLALSVGSSISGYADYARATPGAPSAQTIRNNLGRWSDVKKAADAILNGRTGENG